MPATSYAPPGSRRRALSCMKTFPRPMPKMPPMKLTVPPPFYKNRPRKNYIIYDIILFRKSIKIKRRDYDFIF